MQKEKKQPERRCVGCGISIPKKGLLRVVRAPDGGISLDFTGKKAGRGAYLCKNITCFNKAKKSKRLEKNLNAEILPEIYDQLEKELKEATAKATEENATGADL